MQSAHVFPPQLRALQRAPRAALAALLALCAACDSSPPARGAAPPEAAAREREAAASEPARAETEAVPLPAPEAPGSAPRLGLWVLAEGSQRVLEHPERVPALLATAEALGATDLFVQVYRGGRAWFRSERADAAPFESALAKSGEDPLAQLLERAHAADLRVHAWVNVLSLSGNRNAPLLATLGRDAALVDRRGRSVLDYPELQVPPPDGAYYKLGTPAVWLDPAAPGLSDHLAALFSELLARYPELDGLHLDYIRYPDVLPFTPGSRFGIGLDFGYGEPTRARFLAETGLEAPFLDSTANAGRWDDWRREQVQKLVSQIRGAARAVSPALELSAAVWTYADRAYLALGQDWRGWLADGLLEFAVPMAYTSDDRLLEQMAQSFGGLPQAERIWLGLGVWLFADDPARAFAQRRLGERAGLPSQALFSYDAIAEAPGLASALSQERAATP